MITVGEHDCGERPDCSGLQSINLAVSKTAAGQKKSLTPIKWLNSPQTTCLRPDTSFVSMQERAMDSTEGELVEQLLDDAKSDLVTVLRRA